MFGKTRKDAAQLKGLFYSLFKTLFCFFRISNFGDVKGVAARVGHLNIIVVSPQFWQIYFRCGTLFLYLEREFKAIIILHAFAYDAIDDEYTE